MRFSRADGLFEGDPIRGKKTLGRGLTYFVPGSPDLWQKRAVWEPCSHGIGDGNPQRCSRMDRGEDGMGRGGKLQYAGRGSAKSGGFEPVAKRDQASHGRDVSLDPGNRSGEGEEGFLVGSHRGTCQKD